MSSMTRPANWLGPLSEHTSASAGCYQSPTMQMYARFSFLFFTAMVVTWVSRRYLYAYLIQVSLFCYL
jgi:hypothetical protein